MHAFLEKKNIKKPTSCLVRPSLRLMMSSISSSASNCRGHILKDELLFLIGYTVDTRSLNSNGRDYEFVVKKIVAASPKKSRELAGISVNLLQFYKKVLKRSFCHKKFREKYTLKVETNETRAGCRRWLLLEFFLHRGDRCSFIF